MKTLPRNKIIVVLIVLLYWLSALKTRTLLLRMIELLGLVVDSETKYRSRCSSTGLIDKLGVKNKLRAEYSKVVFAKE